MSFHQFPLLAKEIRDEIWNLAIRPFHHGVHVFSVHTSKECALEHADDMEAMDEGLTDDSYHFSAPRCLPREKGFSSELMKTTKPSWTLNNPSTYLIDSGLWTACAESKRAVGRAYGRDLIKQIKGNTSDPMPNLKLLEMHMPTLEFPNALGFNLITCGSSDDLFILQPQDLFALDWTGVWQNLGGNIALEWDPAWDKNLLCDEGRDELLKVMVRLVRKIVHVPWREHNKIWLIDYRIKRSSSVPTESTARKDRDAQVFHGADRRFTDVTWEVGDWALFDPPADFWRASDFSRLFWEGVNNSGPSIWDLVPLPGLLACEMD
ncbi:hypothetical protein OQA88_10229 [Cercophora sp. LCS_1]